MNFHENCFENKIFFFPLISPAQKFHHHTAIRRAFQYTVIYSQNWRVSGFVTIKWILTHVKVSSFMQKLLRYTKTICIPMQLIRATFRLLFLEKINFVVACSAAKWLWCRCLAFMTYWMPLVLTPLTLWPRYEQNTIYQFESTDITGKWLSNRSTILKVLFKILMYHRFDALWDWKVGEMYPTMYLFACFSIPQMHQICDILDAMFNLQTTAKMVIIKCRPMQHGLGLWLWWLILTKNDNVQQVTI